MEDMMRGYVMGCAENVSEKQNWAFPDTLWILLLLTLPTYGESEIAKAMLDAGFEKLREVAKDAEQFVSEDAEHTAESTE